MLAIFVSSFSRFSRFVRWFLRAYPDSTFFSSLYTYTPFKFVPFVYARSCLHIHCSYSLNSVAMRLYDTIFYLFPQSHHTLVSIGSAHIFTFWLGLYFHRIDFVCTSVCRALVRFDRSQFLLCASWFRRLSYFLFYIFFWTMYLCCFAVSLVAFFFPTSCLVYPSFSFLRYPLLLFLLPLV
ncbi:hypothetical protein BJ912DRAFT_985912 [Pholiota molesta]|nr:hypothetical protein BJ912DRAFT_985912 [Pholiota molesta]